MSRRKHAHRPAARDADPASPRPLRPALPAGGAAAPSPLPAGPAAAAGPPRRRVLLIAALAAYALWLAILLALTLTS